MPSFVAAREADFTTETTARQSRNQNVFTTPQEKFEKRRKHFDC